MIDLSKVTRFELIHHTPCTGCGGEGRQRIEGQGGDFECPVCHGMGTIGREIIFHDVSKKIEASLQDDDRTLKIFIKEREKE